MTPLPGCTPTKPGSACFPFFGVLPVILDESGKEMEGEAEGYIAFKKPWPGIMRTVYGNHERFESTYFQRFPGYYMSGDGAKRDSDGYIWITGRVDDMLNCSGRPGKIRRSMVITCSTRAINNLFWLLGQ